MGQIFNRIKHIAKSQLNDSVNDSDININNLDETSASDDDLAREIENLAPKSKTSQEKKTYKKIDNDDNFSVIEIETN